MVFNNNLLNYLTPDEECDFEFNALEKLAKNGEVMVYKHEGNWECMDHERDVSHLNQLWNDEKAFWKKYGYICGGHILPILAHLMGMVS